MPTSKASTDHHHRHMQQQLHVVAAEKESLLLYEENQPFFLRLLQRDDSLQGSSRRDLVAGLVPFIWEASPGLPKPDLLYNLNHDHNDFLIHPLNPPPMLQSPNNYSFNQRVSSINPDNDSQTRLSFTSKLKTVLSGRRTRLSASQRRISSSLSHSRLADEVPHFLSPRSCSLDDLFSLSPKFSNPSSSASNHGVQSPPELDDMEEPAPAPVKYALNESLARLISRQSSQLKQTTLLVKSKHKKGRSAMTKGRCCFLPTWEG